MTDPGLTKPIPGVPPSEEIRAKLAEEGRPVCVAFSGGKDCIAAELALQESGVETVLAHLYLIPGKEPGRTLGFVEDGLKAMEDRWQKPIHRYPHPSFYRMLNNLVFQPPERCSVIEAANLPTVTYEVMWDLIRADLGLPADTWVADGVRAADSLPRRASIKNHGAMKPKNHKVSPVWDWKQGKVYDYIRAHGVDLPVDYEWFDRSFDGIDHRFLRPVMDNAPEDYAQILAWFPLAEMEIIRHGI
ncbi:hypothetical protein [Corynebacterium pygosceleis]|uniref:hypothetical protein n=1 Tax=Corynebacterium pygosceleis TaxID=2800406 RepID=UPI0020037F74|nr:hypothetical protein [Corynebacterium pygosceleis]MCK7676345.1 hypothetical protein [Corynebacterium pygosceleis]